MATSKCYIAYIYKENTRYLPYNIKESDSANLKGFGYMAIVQYSSSASRSNTVTISLKLTDSIANADSLPATNYSTDW